MSRQFNAIHIDENCENLSGFYENELFYNCTFRNLSGLTLKDCVLTKSRFLTEKLDEAKGFTMTIGDCSSFHDVEYSPFLLNLWLVMAIKSAGNLEMRKKLIELVGKDVVVDLLRQFETMETGKTQ